MYCVKCDKDLTEECVCPDTGERLESLRGSQFLDQRTIVEIPLARWKERMAALEAAKENTKAEE